MAKPSRSITTTRKTIIWADRGWISAMVALLGLPHAFGKERPSLGAHVMTVLLHRIRRIPSPGQSTPERAAGTTVAIDGPAVRAAPANGLLSLTARQRLLMLNSCGNLSPTR